MQSEEKERKRDLSVHILRPASDSHSHNCKGFAPTFQLLAGGDGSKRSNLVDEERYGR